MSVIAANSSGRKHKTSASRFEVEVFGGVGWILQKNFDARIFPAASVVFLNCGTVAIEGFFDCEFHDDAVRRLGKLGCDHRVDDPLVGHPFHIRF